MKPILLIAVSCFLISCNEKTASRSFSLPDSAYIEAGNSIVARTFDTLRNSLLDAIATRNVDGAIEFCNTNALKITDSYADTFLVKRTSLRWRNSANEPDRLESEILQQITNETGSSTAPKVLLVRRDDSIHFFKAIMLQGMCLSCHGKPGKEITSSTLVQINRLYPRDKATNFSVGDLRGVWHITFTQNKKDKKK